MYPRSIAVTVTILALFVLFSAQLGGADERIVELPPVYTPTPASADTPAIAVELATPSATATVNTTPQPRETLTVNQACASYTQQLTLMLQNLSAMSDGLRETWAAQRVACQYVRPDK